MGEVMDGLEPHACSSHRPTWNACLPRGSLLLFLPPSPPVSSLRLQAGELAKPWRHKGGMEREGQEGRAVCRVLSKGQMSKGKQGWGQEGFLPSATQTNKIKMPKCNVSQMPTDQRRRRQIVLLPPSFLSQGRHVL